MAEDGSSSVSCSSPGMLWEPRTAPGPAAHIYIDTIYIYIKNILRCRGVIRIIRFLALHRINSKIIYKYIYIYTYMICIYTNIAAPGTLPSRTNPHQRQTRAVSSPRAAEHRWERVQPGASSGRAQPVPAEPQPPARGLNTEHDPRSAAELLAPCGSRG